MAHDNEGSGDFISEKRLLPEKIGACISSEQNDVNVEDIFLSAVEDLISRCWSFLR
jgi:hypothetical protein